MASSVPILSLEFIRTVNQPLAHLDMRPEDFWPLSTREIFLRRHEPVGVSRMGVSEPSPCHGSRRADEFLIGAKILAIDFLPCFVAAHHYACTGSVSPHLLIRQLPCLGHIHSRHEAFRRAMSPPYSWQCLGYCISMIGLCVGVC